MPNQHHRLIRGIGHTSCLADAASTIVGFIRFVIEIQLNGACTRARPRSIHRSPPRPRPNRPCGEGSSSLLTLLSEYMAPGHAQGVRLLALRPAAMAPKTAAPMASASRVARPAGLSTSPLVSSGQTKMQKATMPTVGIGHSSCILAQRPSRGVMLNTQGEPRDGLSTCLQNCVEGDLGSPLVGLFAWLVALLRHWANPSRKTE
jgi:hypothetical protein